MPSLQPPPFSAKMLTEMGTLTPIWHDWYVKSQAVTGTPAVLQASPANPTGTTSLVGVMMGLYASIAPILGGRVLITITGTIFNATAIGDGANVQIRTGTGVAPANGDPLGGTAAGGLVKYVAATTAQSVPFAVSALVTGLSLNVPIWIDLSLAAVTAGTATVSDLSVVAIEVS